MLPDRATMYVAGAGPGALDLGFWQDVYGFSYRCFQMYLSKTPQGTVLFWASLVGFRDLELATLAESAQSLALPAGAHSNSTSSASESINTFIQNAPLYGGGPAGYPGALSRHTRVQSTYLIQMGGL